MHVTPNVIEKGERLVNTNAVTLVARERGTSLYRVKGDTRAYLVSLGRKPEKDTCGCQWSFYHDSPVCSHKFAARMAKMMEPRGFWSRLRRSIWA